MLSIHVMGYPATLNELVRKWRIKFGVDPLIWDYTRCSKEIRRIQTAPCLAHLSWIGTLEEWSAAFPSQAFGTGTIRVPAAEDLTPCHKGQLIRKINFILDNLKFFKEVTGLEAAAAVVGITVPFDRFQERHQVLCTGFDELATPVERLGNVFQLCKVYGATELWTAFKSYLLSPDEMHWRMLRDIQIPWISRSLSQMLGEQYLSYGIMPSSFEVDGMLTPQAQAA